MAIFLVSRRAALALAGAAVVIKAMPGFAETRPKIVVYKDPKCGCCTKWVKHLEEAGFPASVVETSDLRSMKQQLGVPDELGSCHTAQVESYVIEGHVPVGAILRLLREKPIATGLAVPGMPVGSPGMEGGAPEVYDVVLFGPEGRRSFGRFQGTDML